MRDKIGILKALTLLSQVGIAIILPIIAGVWAGNKLDSVVGTRVLFLAIFTLLGVFVGFRSSYRLIMSGEDRKG
ncbi:AtpZ/AtpI family protein [Halonatronum saccharophilum]|uniref:AtpZ/AtpI family protein n=1 Tax=Halonatronum saccharophilum TaxID=150060 RepID=UPI0004816DDA|nr:AtpZ/AtpI family protein [Halonatronum saccharophilum]